MKRLQAEIRRYLPIILSLLSCAGVAGTAYAAVQNNKKYEEEIKKEYKKTVFDISGIDKSYVKFEDCQIGQKEKLLIFAKCYYPTFIIGVSTMGCILGSNALSHRSQAGLISAYGLLSESFGRYKNKVIEHHGYEEHKKIINELALEDREKMDLYVYGAFSSPSLNGSSISKDDRVYPVHDAYSNRWFEATLSEIIEAEYHLNRNLCLGEVVLMNDYYHFLGLEQTIEGNELGWFLGSEDDYYWIDFSNELMHLADGTEYIEIFFEYPPSTKWQEEW